MDFLLVVVVAGSYRAWQSTVACGGLARIAHLIGVLQSLALSCMEWASRGAGGCVGEWGLAGDMQGSFCSRAWAQKRRLQADAAVLEAAEQGCAPLRRK